jgi:hypothetical protein
VGGREKRPLPETGEAGPADHRLARGRYSVYPLYEREHIDWYVREAEIVKATAPWYMSWVFEEGFVCEELIPGPVVSVAIAASESYAPISAALHLAQDVNPFMGFGSILPLDRNDPFNLRLCA